MADASLMETEKFFNELAAFSKCVLGKLNLPAETPWKYPGWAEKAERPRGAILHYTADVSLRSVLQWFMAPGMNARASAHVVVGERWDTWLVDLAQAYPRVSELPVPVVQCCSWYDRAWHAKAANHWAYGIEICNMGELRRGADGQMVCWRNEWTSPWGGSAVAMNGRWWEPWRYDQIRAVVMLLRRMAYPAEAGLVRSLILGHEQVQANKFDPGPLFPLREVRQAVYDGAALGMALWVQNWSAEQDAYMRRQMQKIAVSYTGATDPSLALAAVREQVIKLVDSAQLVRTMLAMLGYEVASMSELALTELDVVSLRVFQRMMGLDVDGVAGPVTRGALRDRLIERGVI